MTDFRVGDRVKLQGEITHIGRDSRGEYAYIQPAIPDPGRDVPEVYLANLELVERAKPKVGVVANSVEELDALPVGTVVECDTDNGPFRGAWFKTSSNGEWVGKSGVRYASETLHKPSHGHKILYIPE